MEDFLQIDRTVDHVGDLIDDIIGDLDNLQSSDVVPINLNVPPTVTQSDLIYRKPLFQIKNDLILDQKSIWDSFRSDQLSDF